MTLRHLKCELRRYRLLLIISGTSAGLMIQGFVMDLIPAPHASAPIGHSHASYRVMADHTQAAAPSTIDRPQYEESPNYVSPASSPLSPSSPSSAPEPASLMLMAPALVLLARRARKA